MMITNRDVAAHLQPIPVDVLLLIATGVVDVAAMAKQEIASRGLDTRGRWIGFPAAERLWKEMR